MTLEQIHDMWAEDCKYDDLNLDTDSLAIDKLHAKYNRLLSGVRFQGRGLKIKRRTVSNDLRDYYLGILNNPADLQRINRPPQQQKILKNEVYTYVESDREIIDIDRKIAVLEEKFEVLFEIVKAIGRRGFNIRAAIDWKKHVSGF